MGRKSDARQRLIDAAHRLIWEYSYGAVTIDAICEGAGVKKGSFYYFFDSKSDLALAALHHYWVERKALLKDIFQPNVLPLERIRKYLDLVSESQAKWFESSGMVRGCPLFTLGSEISAQDERIRSLIQLIMTSLTGYFEQAIADAQALGEVEGHDAAPKARKLVSYYEGLLTTARIENNVESLRNLSSQALEIIGVRPMLALV